MATPGKSPVVQDTLDEAVGVTIKAVALRNGEKFDVEEMSLAQLSVVVAFLKPFKSRMEAGESIEMLLLDQYEAMLPAIAALTGYPGEQLPKLKASDVTKLVSAALDVNADFFVLQVIPLVPRALGRLQGRLVGLTQSISSAELDTGAVKSSA